MIICGFPGTGKSTMARRAYEMKTAKNICPVCGGEFLIEAIGNYGDVYRMKKNGEMSKRRIRRCIYEASEGYMVYCEKCGNSLDPAKFGY